MPIDYSEGYYEADLDHLDRGVFQRPGKLTRDIVTGIAHTPARIAYDVGSVGIGIYNTLNHPSSQDIDVGDDYWSAIEAVQGIKSNPTQEFTSELSALMFTTTAAASRLAKIPKVSKLLQSSKSWDKIRAGFYTGGLGGAAADLIHTSKDDGSLFAVIPETARPEVLDWFLERKDDSELEGVIKNALEGLAFGTALDTVVTGIAKVMRSSKQVAKQAADNGEDYRDSVDQLLGTGDGQVAQELKDVSIISEVTDNSASIFSTNASIPDSVNEHSLKMKYGGYSKKKRQRKKAMKRIYGSDYKSGTERDVIKEAVASSPRRSETRKQVETIADQQFSLKEAIEAVRRDSTASPEILQKVRDVEKFTSASRATRNSIKTTGDEGFTEIVDAMELLKTYEDMVLPPKSQAIVDKARTKTSMIERVHEMTEEMQTGKWSKHIDDLVFNHGYDKDTVMANMLNYTALNTDIDKMFIAHKSWRHDAAKSVIDKAKAVDFNSDNLNDTLADLAIALDDLDGMDQVLGGAKATVGRLLRSFKTTGNDIETLMRDQSSHAKALRSKKNAGKKLTPEEEELIKPKVSLVLTDTDKTKAELLVSKLKKEGNPSKLSIRDLAKDVDALDILETYVRGSMLSAVSTITGSVLGGNFVATAWKQVVEPTVTAILDNLFRRGQGTSLFDGLQNAASLVTSTMQGVKTFFNRDSNKGLADVLTILDDTAREGAESSLALGDTEFIRKHLDVLAKQWDENGAHTKATIAELMNPLVAKTMGIQNFMIRRISDTDRFFKGVNNNTSLLYEARRMYRMYGGDSNFYPTASKTEFMEQYVSLMNKYADIQFDSKLNSTAKMTNTAKLFKGSSDDLQRAVKESINRAFEVGKEATLQTDVSELWMGRILTDLTDAFAKAGTMGRIASLALIPFKKTPAVFLKEVADHTPYGLVAPRNLAILKDAAADPMDKLRVVSKVVAGSSLLFGVASIAASGKISGSIAPNEREKAKAMGIREHSILIGDTWYSYENLGPLASIISSAADFTNNSYRDPDSSFLTLMGMSLVVASQEGHLRTIDELLDVAAGVRSPTSFALNRASTILTPLQGMTRSGGLIDNGKYRTAIDPEIEGFVQQFKFEAANAMKNNSLFVAGTNMIGAGLYEEDFNVLGDNVLKASNNYVDRTLNLLGVGNIGANTDPYISELARHGLLPGNTRSSTIGGVKLTSNEFKEMRRAIFKGDMDMSWELNNLVTSDLYKSASLSDRKRFLSKAMNRATRAVKEATWDTNKRLRDAKAIMDAFNISKEDKVMKADYESMDYYLDSRKFSTTTDPSNPVALKAFNEMYGL